MPRVSVIMPMYNGLPYVGEGIESIINQTFQDWELLVIDDASTDGSPDVVRQYAAKDSRIKLIRNDSDLHGAGPARNIGIEAATGEYVAMMDADDISLPRRLELQVAFMDKLPKIIMSGCFAKAFGKSNKIFIASTQDWMIKALLFFRREFWHPSLIFRRMVVKEKYPAMPTWEDVHFGVRVSLHHPVANLPKILYRYRVHDNSTTFQSFNLQNVIDLYSALLSLRLGFIPTSTQIHTHVAWTMNLKTVSIITKLRWLAYVLMHGKYTWYERFILATWCSVRTCLINMYRAW